MIFINKAYKINNLNYWRETLITHKFKLNGWIHWVTRKEGLQLPKSVETRRRWKLREGVGQTRFIFHLSFLLGAVIFFVIFKLSWWDHHDMEQVSRTHNAIDWCWWLRSSLATVSNDGHNLTFLDLVLYLICQFLIQKKLLDHD